MENSEKTIQELLKEMKEDISKFQSTLSKLENKLKEMTAEKEESISVETPNVEPVIEPEASETVQEESVVEEAPTLEAPIEEEPKLMMPDGMPAILPTEEEIEENVEETVTEEPNVVMPTEETPILNEEVKEETPNLEMPVEESKSEEIPMVTGYGQGPSNLSKIKEYFASEKLQSIMNGYETETPVVEEAKEEIKEDVVEPSVEVPAVDELNLNTNSEEPNLVMPTVDENINYTVEEASTVAPQETPAPSEYVMSDDPATVVEPSISTETVVEEPVVESNPEAVAENLANNFGDRKRMLSIEEMLKNMEQDFEQDIERKGR